MNNTIKCTVKKEGMTEHIKRTVLLVLTVLYIFSSDASDKDTYEYLPQIPIPAIRKIIGEYAYNTLMYRVKSWDTQGDCANIDELLYATIKCIKTGIASRWTSIEYSLIVTPNDTHISAMHIDCRAQNNNALLLPPTLQSDNAYNKEYKPVVRYKHCEDSLRLIFEKKQMNSGQCQYDCIEATPDAILAPGHAARKAANEALHKARFTE